MTTVHRLSSKAAPGLEEFDAFLRGKDAAYVSFTKGALEALLDNARGIWDGVAVLPLDDAIRSRVESANDSLAAQGMRVLAVGFKPLGEAEMNGDPAQWEKQIVLAGLLGMIDPARPEARDAVLTALSAGYART
jgi:Ca2+-transporting ATPase